MKRRAAAIATLTLVVLGAAIAPASATWTMQGQGAGAARGSRLQPPAGAPVTVTSAGTHLTWRAPATGPTPGGYVVTRDGKSVCTTTNNACDDTNLVPGKTYTYLVTSTAGRFWVSATPLTMTATTTAGGFTLSALSPASTTAGVGLTFTVSATYGASPGSTDTAYTDAHALTISSSVSTAPGGKVSGGPVTPTFVDGTATKVATTVYGSGPQTLTVSDGSRSGGLAINVVPAAASTLELISATTNAVLCAPSGHVTIPAGSQWSARVAILDPYGNFAIAGSQTTVTLTYSGSGTLSKTSLPIPSAGSVTDQSFALSMPTGTLKSGSLTVSIGTSLTMRCGVN